MDPTATKEQSLMVFLGQQAGGELLGEKFFKGHVSLGSPVFSKPDPRGWANISLSLNYVDYLERVLDQMISDGIFAIMVETPEHLPSQIHKNHFSKLLQQIASKRDVPYFNYNTARVSDLNYDTAYFSDASHLNEKGSIVFSNRLYEDLKPIFKNILPKKEGQSPR